MTGCDVLKSLTHVDVQQVKEGAEAAGVIFDEEELAAAASTGETFDFRDFVVLLAIEYINRVALFNLMSRQPHA